MRFSKCKPGKAHSYDKSNICIHCGFDYKVFHKSVKQFEKEIRKVD